MWGGGGGGIVDPSGPRPKIKGIVYNRNILIADMAALQQVDDTSIVPNGKYNYNESDEAIA